MTATLVSESLLQAIAALAQTAGRAIMQIYATPFAVEAKPDATPLTAADRASHELIAAELRRLTPSVPVLSEESAADVHDYRQRRAWSRLWLVDPLDGTKEFINRNGEFTVNIALIEANEPVLGAVCAPALERTYFGARRHGAWRRSDLGAAVAIEPLTPARACPVVVGSRSHRDAELTAALARLGSHETRMVGSAVKFCLVADGTADFYPRFGPTSEWDTAAGQAVLESAGGQVTDLQGAALRYNTRPTLSNPGFLAFADRTRDWRRIVAC